MGQAFDSFVVLAEMRTGSNFLEENLNSFASVECHGELFNPHFIGHANTTELHGISLENREIDPFSLLDAVRVKTKGLAGFRFFHDHDPRILESCLADPRCAKVILTRNPLDTYVSREIVRQTGQWRLNDLKNAKTAKIRFDAQAFEAHLEDRQAFQVKLQRALQTTGQSAFYLTYEDIPDVDVLNGLARFLGVTETLDKISKATKKQNPRSLQEKVENYVEMEQGLSGIDLFAINKTPNFEPRRGPRVPSYVACARAPLLYLPIPSSAEDQVLAWMVALDRVTDSDLQRGFTQKTLRHWKRHAKGHRSFTVLRHPVARLYDAFLRHILLPGPQQFVEIRQTLRKNYKLPIPAADQDANLSATDLRTAFLAFASFVKGNLDGQTSIRTDGAWASQTAVVQGMGQFMLPDHILREDQLQLGLDQVAAEIGRPSQAISPGQAPLGLPLADIYDETVESAVKAAYQRDYMMFGFSAWDAAQA
ncbi:MAG: sulfotransferase domain-containing protein [Marinosulfonomonas sp.]